MRTIKQYDLNIDHHKDGLLFKMSLFNQGKYDREQARTIIKNTGLHLSITNQQAHPSILTKIGLGLVLENKIEVIYSSSEIDASLPLLLNPGTSFAVNFYAEEVTRQLKKFKKEKVIFITFLEGIEQPFFSDSIEGEAIEFFVEELENGELANWAAAGFVRLDKNNWLL